MSPRTSALCLLTSAFLAFCSDPRPVERHASAPAPPAPCAQSWRSIAPGIDYQTLNCTADRNLLLVRIEPKKAAIAALIQPGGAAAGVARTGKWTVAINANFFDHQFQPLGLVVSGDRQLHPLQPVAWESIFLVTKGGDPRIALPDAWPVESTTVAVQAGPRIVVDGKAMAVKAGVPDWRSGVCIDEKRRVILFVTPHESQFTPQAIASIAHDGLACRSAMLFDGGPSAQMFAAGAFSVEGDKEVPTFLVAR